MQKTTGGLVRRRRPGSASEPRLRVRPQRLAVIGLELSCRVVPLPNMLPLARLLPKPPQGATPLPRAPSASRNGARPRLKRLAEFDSTTASPWEART
jgi:hypothetical protein